MLIDKITMDYLVKKERNFWNHLLALDLWYWEGRLQIRLEKLKADTEKEFLDYKRAMALNDQVAVDAIAARLAHRKDYAFKLVEPVFHFSSYQSAQQQAFVTERKSNYIYVLEGDHLDKRTLKTADRIRREALQLHLAHFYQQKLVPAQKPSRFFFDEKRAYQLLHQKAVADVIGISNKLQASPQKPFSRETFDRCLTSSKPLERFQQMVTQSFAAPHETWECLQQELARIEKEMPGNFASFFFGKTKQACLAWQSDLYVKKLHTAEAAIKRFQECVNSFYYWVSTLPVTETPNAQVFCGFMQALENEAIKLQQWMRELNQIKMGFFQEHAESFNTENRLRFQAKLNPINDRLSQVGEKLTRIKANQYGLTRQSTLPQVPAGSENISVTPSSITKSLLIPLAEGIPVSPGNFDQLLLTLNQMYADIPQWQAYLETYRPEIDAFKERLKDRLVSKAALTEMPYCRQGVLYFVKLGHDQMLYAIKKGVMALKAELLTAEIQNQTILQEVQHWLDMIGMTNCEQVDQLDEKKQNEEANILLIENTLYERMQALAERSPAFQKLQPQLQLFVEACKGHHVKDVEDFKTAPLVLKDAQHQATFFNILLKLFNALQVKADYLFDPILQLSHAYANLRKLNQLKDIIQAEMVKTPEKHLGTHHVQAIYDEMYAQEKTSHKTTLRI